MRIEAVEFRHVQIPLRRAFKHALHERKVSDTVIVSVLDDSGGVGWGEIIPRPYVTGETIDGVLETSGPALAAGLVGQTFPNQVSVVSWLERARAQAERNLATLCGLDLALLDCAGKRLGFGVAAVLGGVSQSELPAGVIVGFETETGKLARYCAALRLAGKKHVKVKVGLDDDVERLEAIVKVFKQTPLRLDANAAWSADEAIERLRELGKVATIASIEQPVPADDLEGLHKIRKQTGIAVMADESVCSLDDAATLIGRQAADIFNVRLGKNGGLVASSHLAQRAIDQGIKIHLGTMVGESGLLSRASEIFGRCVGGFECLDGKGQNAFLLEVDIIRDSGEHPIDFDTPGLGVEVEPDRVQAHQVGNLQRITA